MSTYEYILRNPDGRIITERGDFESESAARSRISGPGILVIKIKKVSGPLGGDASFLEKKPSDLDLATFAEQMSVMLFAESGGVRALREVGQGIENKKFQSIVRSLETSVSEGQSLSMAMREHPKTFNSLVTSLIEAGEISSQMPVMLSDLGAMLRKDAELKSKLKSAMIYPGFTAGLAILMAYFMLTKLVPQFTGFLVDSGGKLPALTLALVATSNFLQKAGLFVFIAMGAVIWAFNKYKATPGGKRTIDRLILKTPILGMMVRDVTVARLSRAISLLLENGVKQPQILRILQGIADNEIYRQALIEVGEGVERGESISSGFRNHPKLFTPMMTSMMTIGEESSGISKTMASTADHYEREANRRAENLAKAMEPMMMLVIAVIVGTIVIGMFLPMVSLIQTLQG